jgi:DNA polymerase III epsilon subunit-like protein
MPIEHHTLTDCCAHLGIDLTDAHRALTDTTATARLLGHFIRSNQSPDAGNRAIAAPSDPYGHTRSTALFRPRLSAAMVPGRGAAARSSTRH